MLHGTETSHDDDQQVGPPCKGFAAQIEPAFFPHVHVDQHYGVVGHVQLGQGLLRCQPPIDGVAMGRKGRWPNGPREGAGPVGAS
jgi:hypothetical protein